MSKQLRQALLEHMAEPSYRPQNKSELARALGVPSKQRAALRELIDVLEEEGALVHLRKGTYSLKKASPDLIPGRIRILRSGKILFLPQDPIQAANHLGAGMEPLKEVVVPPHRMMSAMDGDKVAVRLEFTMPKGWRKRHKGRPLLDDMQLSIRVEKILERSGKNWVGVYRGGRGFGRVKGDGTSSPEWIELTERPPSALQRGQVAVVEPVSWGEGRVLPRGKVVETLGWPDDAGVDIEMVIRKYQLPTEFPADVLEEVDALPDDLNRDVLKVRENWTDRHVMSIDPEGARDFDDAVHVEKLEHGWRLAVHIADVSHYVTPGSALDREARLRGNSTYLPDRVLPMLPPRLSDDLCSLRAGEIRLTKVCVMRFNDKGERTKTRFADAYIRNERQMTYAQAYSLMKGDGSDPTGEMLREAWKLASMLRRKRLAQGALDLDFPEIRVLLDEQGVPDKIVSEDYDESHQLIEEFMLAANEAVAEALKNAGRPTIYRVHEDPDEAKLKQFGEECKLYGHTVNNLGDRKNLVKLLKDIKGSPDEQLLKLSLLRSMMRAKYDTHPLGHYGLAKANYCHFTSPIRRYADLVVHRSLSGLMGKKGRMGADMAGLEETAEHISATERVSSDAERDSHRIKLYEWLEIQVASDQPQKWEALVTESRHYGIHVEIPKLQIRGLIRSDRFPKGSWFYEGGAERWSNRRGDRIFAGCKLRVVPIHVDREKQWVDFAMV